LTNIAGVREVIVPTARQLAGGLPWDGLPWDGLPWAGSPLASASRSAAHLRLETGAVHVWRVDLDRVGARFAGLLDRNELGRAERIAREPARRRWMAARGALRALLGAYTEEHPGALRFTSGVHGKPMLDLPYGQLHFNLSHSGGLAVYAVTETSPVGVDVELMARPNARPRGPDFLRAWVRTEAEGKRIGVGVRDRPRPAPTPTPARTGEPASWISELDLGSEAVGAIALAAAPVDFRVYAIDF
jgi:4'-phosphopantetheinyl transferase